MMDEEEAVIGATQDETSKLNASNKPEETRRPLSPASESEKHHDMELTQRWYGAFHALDDDNDGMVELNTIRKQLSDQSGPFPGSVQKCLLQLPEIRDADSIHRDEVDFPTFLEYVSEKDQKAMSPLFKTVALTAYSVLPPGSRPKYIDYEFWHWTCLPPPIFMIIISLIQVGICAHHEAVLDAETAWNHTSNVTVPMSYSVMDALEYNPYRRKEIWRLVTCMLVHQSWIHLINNLIVQLVLGVPLELVHKFWRVGPIYLCGGIIGTLGASMIHPRTYLTGASGGAYALLFAHLASWVINWDETTYPCCSCFPKCMEYLKYPFCRFPSVWVRLVVWSIYVAQDMGFAVYTRYFSGDTSVTLSSHVFGAVSGVILGTVFLKNFQPRDWEVKLWWICIALTTMFFVFALFWNVFSPRYPVHQP